MSEVQEQFRAGQVVFASFSSAYGFGDPNAGYYFRISGITKGGKVIEDNGGGRFQVHDADKVRAITKEEIEGKE